MSPVSRAWDRFADRFSTWLASPVAFTLALAVVASWAVTQPGASFIDYLTAGTFLLGLVILADSTRSTAAMQVKLDELLRVTAEARNDLIAVETHTADEIVAERDRLRSAVATPPP